VTRVVVDAGSCGFTAVIEVHRVDAKTVRIVIASDCEMISKWAEQLSPLDWPSSLGHPEDSFVIKSGLHHIGHVACPIPIAVLKAIEVEVGVAAPKDISIRFHDTGEE